METKVDLKRGDKAEYFAEKISKIGLVVPVQTADKHSVSLPSIVVSAVSSE